MRLRFRLRVYAISFKNKVFVVYFGILALARSVTTFASVIATPPAITPFPPLPIDASNLCGIGVDIHLMLVPYSIGTAFGT